MPHKQSRMESMLFDYGTTNRTDFRRGEILPPSTTKYKEKPGCLHIRPLPLKDLHTLSDWKTTRVPFSLMHKPKPIVRTDPNKVQAPFVEHPDADKDLCIKTRPRLVMTPAISIDDIADPPVRKLVCDYTYTTSTSKATKEAVSSYFSVKAPLPERPAPANPIRLPLLDFPYVSPEWRMDTVTWDNKQVRTYCDATKEFWLAEELPPCSACRDTEKAEADRNMRFQMQAGKQ